MNRIVWLFLMSAAVWAQDGRDVFAKQCWVCHGDGHGTERGPTLANNRKVRRLSIAELMGVIRNGVPAAGMPAFRLSPEDLQSTAVFVRALSASAADANVPGDRAAGEGF